MVAPYSPENKLIDTHCHLADEAFAADRQSVIEKARVAGVEMLVEIAESPATWDAAVELADRYPFIYASLGIHPHHAHECGPEVWPGLRHRLHERLKHPKVVAVGEFGLDYFRMRNTHEQQDYLFMQQLELAREAGKPIVIHCRDNNTRPSPALRAGEGHSAHADIQTALAEFYPEISHAKACPSPHGVIHCFSGTWADAQAYFERGFLIGVDGPVTYPNSKVLQQVVRQMPLERLVLETDSPYLPPQSHRGQRNDPSFIPAIAAAIAPLKHTTLDEVARITSQNATSLFRIS